MALAPKDQEFAVPRRSSIFDVRTGDGQLIPVVCTGATDPIIDYDLLRYARARLSRGSSAKQVRSVCFTIALVKDFYLIAWKSQSLQPDQLPTFVASFLRTRRRGANSSDGTGLCWRPVMRSTVERDRQAIVDFSDFCVAELQRFPLLPEVSTSISSSPIITRALQKRAYRGYLGGQTDFLQHLAHRRRIKLPRSADLNERFVPGKVGRSRALPSTDDVRRVIDATPSLIQKMLLIEAFFGGPRLSEMLHQWRSDVLPGSMRPSLFPDDEPSQVPLVVLAHPSQATFVGSTTVFADRLQHLRKTYNRLPRTEMRGLSEAIGWKGMTFDNPDVHISQVYWTSKEYALYYYELFKEAQQRVYACIPSNILLSHPYMYVNEMPGRKQYGMPIKLSNARKIFHRAFDRADLNLRSCGSHVARHYYDSVLEDLLPDPHDRQRCMHHRSIVSQDPYALSAKIYKLNKFLAAQ